jgi:hypothetical protein
LRRSDAILISSYFRSLWVTRPEQTGQTFLEINDGDVTRWPADELRDRDVQAPEPFLEQSPAYWESIERPRRSRPCSPEEPYWPDSYYVELDGAA